jgi:ribosomal protein S1
MENRIITWTEILESYRDKTLLEGTVTEISQSGITVDLGGKDAFIPAKYSLLNGETMDQLKNTTIKCTIIKISAISGNILASRTLCEEHTKTSPDMFQSLNTDTIYQGVVKKVFPYGLLVLFEGVTGLIEANRLSWVPDECNTDKYQEGDIIDVRIEKIKPEKNKILLTRRHEIPLPEGMQISDIVQGQRADGIITEIKPDHIKVCVFGTFNGIIIRNYLNYDTNYYTVGEAISCVIAQMSAKKMQMNLIEYNSNKELLEKKSNILDSLTVDSVVDVTVVNIHKARIDVKINELDIYGAILRSELLPPYNTPKVSDVLKANIIEIIRKKYIIKLSNEYAFPSPWEKLDLSLVRKKAQLNGVVTYAGEYECHVKLFDGIIGVINSVKLKRGNNEIPNVGDKVLVEIAKSQPKRHELTLKLIQIYGSETKYLNYFE